LRIKFFDTGKAPAHGKRNQRAYWVELHAGDVFLGL
jgi:hypothetical protein